VNDISRQIVPGNWLPLIRSWWGILRESGTYTCTSKAPVTAVHVFNNKVLPFFEEHNCSVITVFSDNGREYCERLDNHPFELFLQFEEIEH
jgi:hypothetical protein